jgi:hypothetical protein
LLTLFRTIVLLLLVLLPLPLPHHLPLLFLVLLDLLLLVVAVIVVVDVDVDVVLLLLPGTGNGIVLHANGSSIPILDEKVQDLLSSFLREQERHNLVLRKAALGFEKSLTDAITGKEEALSLSLPLLLLLLLCF